MAYAQRVSRGLNAPTSWSGDVIGRQVIELANIYCVCGKIPFFEFLV